MTTIKQAFRPYYKYITDNNVIRTTAFGGTNESKLSSSPFHMLLTHFRSAAIPRARFSITIS